MQNILLNYSEQLKKIVDNCNICIDIIEKKTIFLSDIIEKNIIIFPEDLYKK